VNIKRFLKETKEVLKQKILGLLLYYHGLPYLNTSKILGVIEGFIHEAVHYWHKQFQELFAIVPEKRRYIAFD